MTAAVDVDLSDVAFWQRPPRERAAAFARLRALDRPMFVPEVKIPFMPQGRGYHALVRHADVTEASRNAKVFSSEPTANSVPDLPRWMAVYFGSMINMDDPGTRGCVASCPGRSRRASSARWRRTCSGPRPGSWPRPRGRATSSRRSPPGSPFRSSAT